MSDRIDRKMKCPACGRYTLRKSNDKITCSFCGRQLTPGEATNYRLFELLDREK